MSEVELILTKLKIVSETEERGAYICDKEHSKLLLDYISNLQEENIKLNIKLEDKAYEQLKVSYKKLQEENDDLKNRLENATADCNLRLQENERLKNCYCNRADCGERIKNSKKYSSLQQRITKAIEYIENDWYELNTRDIEHVVNLGKDIRIDLLNILQGEDNEII